MSVIRRYIALKRPSVIYTVTREDIISTELNREGSVRDHRLVGSRFQQFKETIQRSKRLQKKYLKKRKDSMVEGC